MNWLLASIQKTYVYSKNKSERFRVQIVSTISIMSAYIFILILLGMGDLLKYQGSNGSTSINLSRSWMLKKVIGLQIILATSLLPLSAIIAYTVSKAVS